jgi:transcriptional regulator with XRE-family HTH domain
MDKIGAIIRARRRALQLRQADLAEIAGISLGTLGAMEAGTANPAVDTLRRVLEVLGLTLTVQVK